MCFLSYALCFSVRVDLAVAIVDMVDNNGDSEVCKLQLNKILNQLLAVLSNGSSLSPCHDGPDPEFKEEDQGEL